MKHLLFSLILIVLNISTLMADVPFRQHRMSVFEWLPVSSDNIVFIGNSITQGNEWWEAFNNPKILNRGISGAITEEVVENISYFVAGKPEKVFIKIGTNNGAEPQVVIPNTEKIIDYIQQVSPTTEIYIASILPTTREKRNPIIVSTNELIKELCDNKLVTYIDLWSHFIEPGTIKMDPLYSNDGLHLLASGYRLWCNLIARVLIHVVMHQHCCQ